MTDVILLVGAVAFVCGQMAGRRDVERKPSAPTPADASRLALKALQDRLMDPRP